MRVKRYIISFGMIWISSIANGQLSPGDLTLAHADLEGVSNCTQCHELGDKPTNSKCLNCHDEIRIRVNQNKGYHSSSEVKHKDCFTCHSEHHGRKFDMIRFDVDEFDHELTQYLLKGEHKVLDCKQCHTSEFISDPELRKKKMTYLGLNQECLTCHDDFHQKTLSNDCLECHNFKKFRPAEKFDHNTGSGYKLLGKHMDVECKECHPKGTLNGKDFQQFTEIKHNDCVVCHDDPHLKNLKGKCATCHTEKSFSYFIGKKRFRHKTTNFELLGRHKAVDCFICHKRATEPQMVFQDRLGISENQCAKCHTDVHEGRFGNNCSECHNENGFNAQQSTLDKLDHSLTGFPLEGLHVQVDCRKCHTETFTKEIEHSRCNSCHDDFHEGEFEKKGSSPDCSECHSVEKGFYESLYDLDKHQESDFPLEGAHQATPCFECHISENKWTFRDLGNTCIDCHIDTHYGQFAQDGITDCESCHTTQRWFPDKFNHDQTNFPLDGKHKKVACEKCHQPIKENGLEFVEYKLKSYQCIDCH